MCKRHKWEVLAEFFAYKAMTGERCVKQALVCIACDKRQDRWKRSK